MLQASHFIAELVTGIGLRLMEISVWITLSKAVSHLDQNSYPSCLRDVK